MHDDERVRTYRLVGLQLHVVPKRWSWIRP